MPLNPNIPPTLPKLTPAVRVPAMLEVPPFPNVKVVAVTLPPNVTILLTSPLIFTEFTGLVTPTSPLTLALPAKFRSPNAPTVLPTLP